MACYSHECKYYNSKHTTDLMVQDHRQKGACYSRAGDVDRQGGAVWIEEELGLAPGKVGPGTAGPLRGKQDEGNQTTSQAGLALADRIPQPTSEQSQ